MVFSECKAIHFHNFWKNFHNFWKNFHNFWKNFHHFWLGKNLLVLFERLAPLGTMGDQLSVPPKPLNTINSAVMFGRCRGGCHHAERRQFLYVWSFFPVQLSYTEKSFRNLIKSYLNQIVFTMYRLIWNSKRTSFWFKINRCMVNTIWYRFDLIRFRKDFSVWSSSFSSLVNWLPIN